MNRLRAFLSLPLGTVGSIVGIGSGLNSIFGHHGSGGSGAGSTVYTPTGSGAADQSFQQMLTQLQQAMSGYGNQVTPAMTQAFGNLMGIPTSGLTDAGGRAGRYYNDLASGQDALGGALRQQGGQAAGAGQQLWNTALDPENQLRNTLQQQVTDASRAGTSARGIGMSPQAAGIENQDVSNFLMNWQDRQLGRQSTGLQGMLSAFGQAGQDYTGASNMGTAAAGNIMNSGTVPYQANTMAAGAPFNYAQMFNQGMGGMGQNMAGVMSQIIPYLYAGQGAAGMNFNQGQVGVNNLTTGLQQLGKSPFLQNVFNNQPLNSQDTMGTNYNIFSPPTFDQPYGG